MNIAGGISAALFHRERTGEAVELDVSLLSTAWWAAGASVTQGMETGETMRSLMPDSIGPTVNPFLGNYLTSDGGTINLCIVSPTGYIRDAFEHLGLPELADDPRFSDVMPLIENAAAAAELIAESIRSKPFDYWRQHLKTMKGQWAPFQSLIDLAADEQAIANDMIVEVEASDGGAPFKVVRGPVQFNHEPLETTRAPQASEHTEIVLMELGHGLGSHRGAQGLRRHRLVPIPRACVSAAGTRMHAGHVHQCISTGPRPCHHLDLWKRGTRGHTWVIMKQLTGRNYRRMVGRIDRRDRPVGTCENELRAKARFCDECGAPVSAQPDSANTSKSPSCSQTSSGR